ncbi:5'/3'-nucleotidase SurE [Rhodococcus sp. NPDC058514]|uniref:5'/3'-nucleotidase SurE n=1 Tax=unclassified Rhodococcus (in: high G+C Gram-positive bacteria) TaxID=192944 RepID=UPI003653E002
MRFTRPLIVAAVATTTALAVAAGAGAIESLHTAPPADSAGAPLRILLTNDDGWEAPGITATYKALTAAGHDVTLVAPAVNQSGKSAAIDFQGKLTVTHPNGDPKVYSVTSTPAGSAMFGINEVFKDAKPDLVVSGTNVGSNVGFDTNYSGTVGAAVMASGSFGIPAIAISTATSRKPEVVPAYAQTADLLVKILSMGIPRTGPGTVLNINYPLLEGGATAPKGMKYTPMSSASAADIRYSRIDDTTYEIKPARAAAPPEAGTDFAELDAGFVTFTLLDADRTVDTNDAVTVSKLVKSLS